MYEEIIDKMQGKINKLTEQNRSLDQKLRESRVHDRQDKDQKQDDGVRFSKDKINQLMDKIQDLTDMYNDLEEKVRVSDKEWEMWKDQWTK